MIERAQVPREQIAAALWYIWHVGHVPPGELLGFTQAHAGPKLETIMKTSAEQMRDEGRAEGRAEGRDEGRDEGRAEGKVEILLKLVQLKFGVVPSKVGDAIQSATLEQLDRWVERVLSAERAEDIIGE